ncbi:MAG: lysophospholipid acyltransferase family protein [Nevskiales bacterium]
MTEMRAVLKALLLALHVLAGFLIAHVAMQLPRYQSQWEKLVAHWYAALLSIMNVHLNVRGESHAGVCLRASNHVSWLDVPVLGVLGMGSFVAKSEIARWPVFGRMAQTTQTVFIVRGAYRTRETIEEMKHRLCEGRSVLFFPEGTTGEGRDLLKFYPRLFAAAIESGVPVQPVSLSYARSDGAYDAIPFVDDEAFLPHLWGLLKLPRIEVDVSFAHAVTAVSDRLRKPVSADARATIAGCLAETPKTGHTDIADLLASEAGC